MAKKNDKQYVFPPHTLDHEKEEVVFFRNEMTKEEISNYITIGTFSTEQLEPTPKDGSLRWYYRDNNGKLHTGTASSRFTALKEAESLGFNSWE